MVFLNLLKDKSLTTVHPKQRSVENAAAKKKLPPPPPSPPFFNYAKFNKKELRKSVQDRNLVKSSPSVSTPQGRSLLGVRNLSTSDLRRKLEVADKSPSFSLFEQLPAEIRVRIYKYAIPHSTTVHPRPKLHPLCQVSQLLRRESLEVFFARRSVSTYINATSLKFTSEVTPAAYDWDVQLNLRQYETFGWLPYMRNFYVKVIGGWHDFVQKDTKWFTSKFEVKFNGLITEANVTSANCSGRPQYDVARVDRRLTRSVKRGLVALQAKVQSGQRQMTKDFLEHYILQALVRYC